MGYLKGLKEYLDESYESSIFDRALASGQPWIFHLHGHRMLTAAVVQVLKYDLKVENEGLGMVDLPKVQVKFLYPAEHGESVGSLIKIDEHVRALGLEPILAPGQRYFVKNKSLFPLMQEREVVFFTLLEGEIIRGIVTGFSRYEITVNLKNGRPLTILRHSIYDLRNKKGRSFLKTAQENYRDWEKSPLYVA